MGAFEQRLFRLGVRDGDIIFYADNDGTIHVLSEAPGGSCGGAASSARRPLSQSERALEALNLETYNATLSSATSGIGVGQLRTRLMVLKNDMTFGNCVWFIVSSFVHQNAPYTPRYAL